jgi:hypothetical protein
MMDSTCLLRHLGSSMILTVEGTYCSSSEELCDFDMRRHVQFSLLMSKSYSSPDDGQYVPSTVKIKELPR